MAFFSKKKNKKKKENASVADERQSTGDASSIAAPAGKTRTSKRGRTPKFADEPVFQNPPVELKSSTNESLSEKLAKVAPAPEKPGANSPDEVVAQQFDELRRVVRESEARERAEQEAMSPVEQPPVNLESVALSGEEDDQDGKKMSRRERRREDKAAAKIETRRAKSEKSGGMFHRKKKADEIDTDAPMALGEKEKIDEDLLKVAAVVEARKSGGEASQVQTPQERPSERAPAARPADFDDAHVEALRGRPLVSDETAASVHSNVEPMAPVELNEPVDVDANPMELTDPAQAIEKQVPPTNIPVESLHLRVPTHWLGLWVSEDGRSFYLEDAGRGSYLATALPDPMSNCHFGPDFPELETWRMPSAFVREPVGDIVADRLSIETVPGLPPEFLSPLVFLYFLVDVGDDENEGNRFAEPEDGVEDIYIATDFDPGTANPWGDGEIPWLGGSGTYYKAPEKLDDYVLRRMENQEPRNNPE